MIQILDKHNCCGCNACVQKCPKQCISMHEDEEGFLYPIVDLPSALTVISVKNMSLPQSGGVSGTIIMLCRKEYRRRNT